MARRTLPNRRSIRLRGYDYTRPGAYFVTIVTEDRRRLFGNVVQGVMRPSDAGRMVQDVWEAIPRHYPGVGIDAFALMPDHVHGIVVLGRREPIEARLSVPDVVHRFKTLTTKCYVDGIRAFGWPPFHRRLWHRNYYEHIVRDEFALLRIRSYISENPVRWASRRSHQFAAATDHGNEWERTSAAPPNE